MTANNERKYARRAVAPIIATLLMVAIAVVGGILIFVFAQGFFTDTNIGAPTIESLVIYGYDAGKRSTTTAADSGVKIRPHNWEKGDGGITTTSVGASFSKLEDGNHIALYVSNIGNSAVVISSVRVFGDQYLLLTAAGCNAGDGEFALFHAVTDDCSGGPNILPGRDATIVIGYDTEANGDVKVGRPIGVTIVTANGATFSKQVQVGLQQGGAGGGQTPPEA